MHVCIRVFNMHRSEAAQLRGKRALQGWVSHAELCSQVNHRGGGGTAVRNVALGAGTKGSQWREMKPSLLYQTLSFIFVLKDTSLPPDASSITPPMQWTSRLICVTPDSLICLIIRESLPSIFWVCRHGKLNTSKCTFITAALREISRLESMNLNAANLHPICVLQPRGTTGCLMLLRGGLPEDLCRVWARRWCHFKPCSISEATPRNTLSTYTITRCNSGSLEGIITSLNTFRT